MVKKNTDAGLQVQRRSEECESSRPVAHAFPYDHITPKPVRDSNQIWSVPRLLLCKRASLPLDPSAAARNPTG